ncbi:iron complex transport system permease protein [Rosenbergiella nectarea]|uniref:Iron complex transport system permease protein n=1 Tax=Rosenbergiella nectarea TaxID=988801 RepID=A0A1H9G9Q0_9GAMM|nr:Fe(3+)-hydroxamate ABC transporter permease FhuB [Rosenbergiella nectarea]SEQ46518.1 iron complex transport system permease protein [Rosenbergiella nectarea]
MTKLRAGLAFTLLPLFTALMIGWNIQHLFSSTATQPGMAALLWSQSYLPRIIVAALAGAALGLCGMLAQLVLKNPLAEPATLGIASGAQLGTTLALFAGVSPWITQSFALAGGFITTAIIYALSRHRGMSPLTLLLTGMVVGLFCSVLQNGLVLFHHEQMQSLFIWNSGNLAQNDWSVVSQLCPILVGITVLVLLSTRALALLKLSDEVVDSLGGNSRLYRLFTLGMMALLAAWTVSQVGLISFIGLFAPQITRLFPRLSFKKSMLLGMAFGAGLLLFCDQLALFAEAINWQISAGNLTAIMGIPVMLLIIVKARFPQPPALGGTASKVLLLPKAIKVLLIVALLGVFFLAFTLTHSPQGWQISVSDPYNLRWPRMVMAIGCGGLLASAGVILQRLTNNPLASPEVLGINSGAACAVVLLLVLMPNASGLLLFSVAALGAMISLGIIILFAINASDQTPKILLVGTALGAFSLALITLFLASGAPNSGVIISWLSGSTWGATPEKALASLVALLLSLPISLLFTRWLTLLPLGRTVASSRGLSLRGSTTLLIIWCATLSAGATLLLGPMSFVGLLAPQIARYLGIYRFGNALWISVVCGALLMLAADFIGRMIMWPFQVPAGIVAVILGAPGLLWLLYRKR